MKACRKPLNNSVIFDVGMIPVRDGIKTQRYADRPI